MSDLLRRLNKVADGLEAIKESSKLELHQLTHEERDLFSLNFSVKLAKSESLIPSDFENPSTKLAEQISSKLKLPNNIDCRLSVDERKELIMRLKRNRELTREKEKARWERYIKEIPYPF